MLDNYFNIHMNRSIGEFKRGSRFVLAYELKNIRKLKKENNIK